MSEVVAVMVDRAEGNESIGTRWQEVGLFDAGASIGDVLKWAETLCAVLDGRGVRGTISVRFAHDNRGGK